MILYHSKNSSSDALRVAAVLTIAYLQDFHLLICNLPSASRTVTDQNATITVDRLELQATDLVCNYVGTAVDVPANAFVEWKLNVSYYSAHRSGRHYNAYDDAGAFTKTIEFFATTVMNTTASGESLLTTPAVTAAQLGIDGIAVTSGEKIYYMLDTIIPEVTSTLTFLITLKEEDSRVPDLQTSLNATLINKSSNLKFASYLSISSTSSNQWILDFGRVRNDPDNDDASDNLRVPVCLNVSNVNIGQRLQLDIFLIFEEARGGKRNLSTNTSVTIVAPDLSILFTLSGNPKDAGDSLAYVIAIKHNANSTGAAQHLYISFTHEPLFVTPDGLNSGFAVFSRKQNEMVALDGDLINYVALPLLEIADNVTVTIPLILSNETRFCSRSSTNATMRYRDMGVYMLCAKRRFKQFVVFMYKAWITDTSHA